MIPQVRCETLEKGANNGTRLRPTSAWARQGGNWLGHYARLLDALLEFELTVKGDDVMRDRGLKPGPELGLVILEIETDNFQKLLV